jgi:hypothetical protein
MSKTFAGAVKQENYVLALVLQGCKVFLTEDRQLGVEKDGVYQGRWDTAKSALQALGLYLPVQP